MSSQVIEVESASGVTPTASSVTLETDTLVDRLSLMAERASDARLPRADLHAELVVSGVVLAQHLVEEIVSRRLPRAVWVPGSAKDHDVYSGEYEADPLRHYRVERVRWRPSRLSLRTQTAHVLTRAHYAGWECSLLWDPRQPDADWDVTLPPLVRGLCREAKAGVYERMGNGMFRSTALATATMLASFGSDAEAIMQQILDDLAGHTDHLADGLRRADAALGLLER